jgi:Kef-type K+ transport system membrane component KefB
MTPLPPEQFHPMGKFAFYYLLALLLSVLAIAGLAEWGGMLYPAAPVAAATAAPTAAAPELVGRLRHPLALLLLQMVVVIVAARLLGRVIRRFGQPAVIGEILAGVLLGPSLLGLLWPQALDFLFPSAALGPLQLLAQLGVLLFMFGVGLELDLGELRRQARTALVVSHASMALPFLLGMGLALTLFPQLAPAGVPFQSFALFFGIAMSITAFPVLARILEERRISDTPIGRSALASAAVGDASAWCLLALVVALAQSGGPDSAPSTGSGQALLTAALTLAFALAVYLLLKPLLARLFAARLAADRGGSSALALALVLLLGCAAFTEVIGIHALFGAFLAGTAMPRGAAFRAPLKERLHGFSMVGLLPLFFALTGLRTQIGLLQGLQDWLLCALIVLAAVAGKLGGTVLAARWTGSPWRESFALGALMNTRGLMELIVLNLGYDLGILSARVFTMLVLMALLTTCMAGPLLHWLRAAAPASAGFPGKSVSTD